MRQKCNPSIQNILKTINQKQKHRHIKPAQFDNTEEIMKIDKLAKRKLKYTK